MKIVHGIEVLTTIDELTSPKQTAILVIDMQNADVSPGGGSDISGYDLRNHRSIIPNIQGLLEEARRTGVLVIYVEFIHMSSDGVNLMDGPNLYVHRNENYVGLVRPNTWASQTIDELSPLPGDLVFPKSRGSAFRGTPLDSQLRSRQIRNLILTGIATSGCVLSTHSDAMMSGYYPVVISDAVAAFSKDVHQPALDWMSRRAPVFKTGEVLKAWRNSTIESNT